jgi:cell filamentation protein
MDATEARALGTAMDALIRNFAETHRFTAADICEAHGLWLGEVYEWAGHYRQVNVSKEAFPFAAAGRVPVLMEQYERDVLGRCTPCNTGDRENVVRAPGGNPCRVYFDPPLPRQEWSYWACLVKLDGTVGAIAAFGFSSFRWREKE